MITPEIVGIDLDVVGPYRVTLSSVGNPDFGQNPNRPLPGVRRRIDPVKTLNEASEACCKFIAEHALGSGNWAGGEVTTEDGCVVARISYNGRVWSPPVK